MRGRFAAEERRDLRVAEGEFERLATAVANCWLHGFRLIGGCRTWSSLSEVGDVIRDGDETAEALAAHWGRTVSSSGSGAGIEAA